MFDLAEALAASVAKPDQEIVLTIDIRVILLVILLAVAGCMPAKQAQRPASAGPDAQMANGRIENDTPVDSDAPSLEAVAQGEDVDPVDMLPDREDIPESADASADEGDVLDPQYSFPVGLDTDEHAEVQRYFRYYTRDQRRTMEHWLVRAQRYLPHIRARFLAEGLPEDLAYLPFAESGFNPFAVSPAGAGGMWQFMPGTARVYGLTVDNWVDERRDPYKSTEAAIKYLKRLHGYFDDWLLAVAAYNAGEGAVGRALKETGCNDFFELCESGAKLKTETKLYVPKFLALVKVARNLEKLGFEPLDLEASHPKPVYLKAKPHTDLLEMAATLGMSWKTFRELNPSLRKQEIPRTVRIAVPSRLVATARDFLKRPITPKPEYATYRVRPGDTWWGVSRKYKISVKALQSVNTVKKKLHVGQVLRIPVDFGGSPAASEARAWAAKRANYVVQPGDTLWSIARQFQTDTTTLKRANGLGRSSLIRVGQKLFVPDAGSGETRTARAQSEAVRQELVHYKVRPGDSLWDIARRFGVTTSQLRSWNKLAENGYIRPGDQLKVYTR
jgi:membrane-bound lytic murein transglycosylase D